MIASERAPAHGSRRPQLDRLGAALAAAAFAWHTFLLSKITNDNFLHMTLAQQMLAGDWPVRDFFEHGWVLQYTLSAAAQLIGGDRLLSEAVIVGAAWAIATYVVSGLVRRLTGSAGAAATASVLLIVAGARGYSYPKGIVYAVAAALWWAYALDPRRSRIVAAGAWAAAAFYWRPDHGIYVAVGLTLGCLAVHGLRRETTARVAIAAATMIALVAPFLVYVQLTLGLVDYAATGLLQARVEHTTHGTHEWPLLRFSRALYDVESAEPYAPRITIRWAAASTVDARRRILEQYGLAPLETDSERVVHVSVSKRALQRLRALINEPAVEDTAGVDRSTATLEPGAWSRSDRWRFEHPMLRVRLLPTLDAHARASELASAAFYVIPIVLAAAAPWIPRFLPAPVTVFQLVAFAAYALLVDVALLRNPFPARAADAVVLPAIAFALMVAAMWRASSRGGSARSVLLKAGAVTAVVVVTACVSGAGQFADRVSWLAGRWTSIRLARGAWEETYGQLTASPPLAYFRDRPASVSLRLAAYVRDCVPETDRLLVLWFAPEIHYLSARLMAQRHLVFAPAWAELEHEQRLTLEKIKRFSPPIVLARRSALAQWTRPTYPGVAAYVEQQYAVRGTVTEDGEEYLIYGRRGRLPLRAFGPGGWPCYTPQPTTWSRVGRVDQ